MSNEDDGVFMSCRSDGLVHAYEEDSSTVSMCGKRDIALLPPDENMPVCQRCTVEMVSALELPEEAKRDVAALFDRDMQKVKEGASS